MDLASSTALVTGANRGLGRAIAAELVRRGATVYAGARNPDAVDLPGVKAVQLDITEPASLAAAAEAAQDVNLLINNAGVGTGADLLDGDLDQIRLEMETNYFGTLAATRAFAPVIEANGGGSILNILSIVSWIASPRLGGYSAAKSAQWSLTNSLRQQLAEHRIRVSGLHVGYIDTDLARAVTEPKHAADDVARAAVDGIAADAYEIVFDERSRQVQASLAGGVAALYPALQ